ncbi:hypothetical protein [Streptomyces sp. S.PNR 29]|uniref:hypothetical protein n=1 Tax=Streptomyces sp. S.PNR 29 TaxID=2973805 RepID=UPI0025AFA103|nr:hypothetical protein [Streptomyces sp. S.PNR 29]MDN0193575.1 hypothetical protein [Streptomyces sp. S.PNR 29]
MSENMSGADATVGLAREDAWWRADVFRWLLFSLVCAGGSLGLAWLSPVVPLWGPLRAAASLLAWLVLPLASVLVPVLVLRRIPRKQRKVAWQCIVPLVAGVALGILGKFAGDQSALAERGEWTDAVVVDKRTGKTDYCALRATNGREISPDLSEGEGCRAWVSEGDELRVRYDPEGVASPTKEVRTTSYGGLLTAFFFAAVVMGTWGGVRQSRWDREYGAGSGGDVRGGVSARALPRRAGGGRHR